MRKTLNFILWLLGGMAVGTVVGISAARFDSIPTLDINVSFPVFIILVVVHFLLAIIIHELGHLVCGLLTGYRFSSFRLASFVWFKESGQIRFKISSNSFAAGQCLMEPVDKPEDFKFVLYNFGGALFNLLLALLLIVSSMEMSSYGAFLNLMFVLVNLIPLKSLFLNDGANILEALKSKEATRGLYLMLRVNHELVEGKRFRDYDENAFTVEEGSDLSNYVIAYILMLEASRLEDLGRYDEFAEVHKRLVKENLPSLYGAMVKADLLYYYSFYAPDYDEARKLYADKKLKNFLNMSLPGTMRISAAYEFYVAENKEKAAKLLIKAKKSAANLPNLGQRTMELEYLQTLIDKVKGDHDGLDTSN